MTRTWEGSNDMVAWTQGVAPDSSNFRYVRPVEIVDEPRVDVSYDPTGFRATIARLERELAAIKQACRDVIARLEDHA